MRKNLFFRANANDEAYLMRTNGRRRVERLLRCLARALQEKHIMRGMFSRRGQLPANLQRHKSRLISPLPPLAFFAAHFEGAEQAAITEWLCGERYNPRPRLLLTVMFLNLYLDNIILSYIRAQHALFCFVCPRSRHPWHCAHHKSVFVKRFHRAYAASFLGMLPFSF